MKLLFIIISFFAFNSWAQVSENLSEIETGSDQIYSTIEDTEDQIINFSSFKDEMNFLENKSQEITNFLDKEQVTNSKSHSIDEISLTSSALKRSTTEENKLDEIKKIHNSEEEVKALLEPEESKVHPRRIRQR